MMQAARDILLVILSLAILAGALQMTRALGRHFELSAEVQRKIIHVATGFYALLFPLMFNSAWPVLTLMAASVVLLTVLRLPAFAGKGLSAALHGVSRVSHGEIYLAVAIGLLFIQSRHEPVLYVLPLLTITLCDAAAALIGVSYGRRIFTVESGEKSWEGSIVFFALTWLLAMIVLLLMTDVPRQSVILLGFMTAMVGTLVEAGSWKGLDNLFVPLSIHLLLGSHMHTPPSTLLLHMAIFAAIVLAARIIAGGFGLNRHAMRGFAILFFMAISITRPLNALPLAALVIAHAAATRARPSQDAHADFSMLAAAAIVALGWFFAGEMTGRSAITLFSMTFAAASAALAALALQARPTILPVIASIAAGLLAVLHLGSAEALSWTMTIAAIASVSLSAAVSSVLPQLFYRHRASRIFAVALAIPLILFIAREISA